MALVNCNASNCGYNKNKYCYKQSLKIEGLFSRSKLGTFCQSFRNPYDSYEFKEEMASEMFDDIKPAEENKNYVGCSANYCAFNNDNYCTAKEIKIGNTCARYRSETQCDSFRLK